MKEQIKQIITEVSEDYGYEFIPDAREALKEVKERLDKWSPWISVEEEPTYSDRSGKLIVYLFCDINDAAPNPIYGKYVGERKFLTLGGTVKKGTHYMELPQPPAP